MEPQMIDHYNEIPHNVNVIDKMNGEFSELQTENEKLKGQLKKYEDYINKDKVLKFISCCMIFCEEDRWWFDEDEPKLAWFHDYNHILEEFGIKISDKYIIMFTEWMHRENIDDSPPEYLIQKSHEYGESVKDKALEMSEKYFDCEYDRAMMIDLSAPVRSAYDNE